MLVRHTLNLRVGITIGVLALTLAAGCTDQQRPTAAEWRPMWSGVVGDLPTAAELGDPPNRTQCNDALGVLRATQGDLFPTPDLAIDSVVREWVTIAEDALFECPPASETIPDLAFAFGELRRLQAEVDAVLIDLDEGG